MRSVNWLGSQSFDDNSFRIAVRDLRANTMYGGVRFDNINQNVGHDAAVIQVRPSDWPSISASPTIQTSVLPETNSARNIIFPAPKWEWRRGCPKEFPDNSDNFSCQAEIPDDLTIYFVIIICTAVPILAVVCLYVGRVSHNVLRKRRAKYIDHWVSLLEVALWVRTGEVWALCRPMGLPLLVFQGIAEKSALLTATVKAALDEPIEALRLRAQAALGVGSGRLVDSFGAVLDGAAPIKDVKVQNGDALTFHISQVQACSTRRSFAAILGDASVVTWGDMWGRSLRHRLKTVHSIKCSRKAFAAILADGSVVTWGDSACGGDPSVLFIGAGMPGDSSRGVSDQLKNVKQIQASGSAFAAIRDDGTVVTWGLSVFGADSDAVQDKLKDVQQIQASEGAFAAILRDGAVVSWGGAGCGGDCSHVQEQLQNVKQIQASASAFAAIRGDGTVVTWGDSGSGADSSSLREKLNSVKQIQSSERAFAAILGDRTVVTWGHVDHGGDSGAVQHLLKNVQQIQASDRAFAAILGDGTVVSWGHADAGGDSTAVKERLKNVQQIQASRAAFAAILGDGTVVTWGLVDHGGDSGAVQHLLKNVQQIQASDRAFAAILGDGAVVSWGHPDAGGDSSAVQDQLKTVEQIQAAGSAFAAFLADGALVTWGDPRAGGDCGALRDLLGNPRCQDQDEEGVKKAETALRGYKSSWIWGKNPRIDTSELRRDRGREQSLQAGVSVAYLISDEFLDTALQATGMKDPTFHDLKQAFFMGERKVGAGKICPRDGRLGVSLIDTLPRQHRQKCTHFLSWSWAYTVRQVRSGLELWIERSGLDPSQTFLFMCFFVNNQHRIVVSGDATGSDDLDSIFEGGGPNLVDQEIWTIFEQYVAVTRDIEVKIVLPRDAEANLFMTILKGAEGIALVKESLCTVDSASADAWSPQDKEAIQKKILASCGFDNINEHVRKVMINWIGDVEARRQRRGHCGQCKSGIHVDAHAVGDSQKAANLLSDFCRERFWQPRCQPQPKRDFDRRQWARTFAWFTPR
eukprot:s4348_g1.t1